jgi:SpoVK/Ycf46/Vps4 family AAA+-type ATPase
VASTQKLSKLFHAVAQHDFGKATEIASEIAGQEEKRGHRDAARLLRGSLRPNQPTNGSASTALLHPTSAQLLSQSLAPQTATVSFAELCLRRSVRTELETIMQEWRYSPELMKAGIRRRSRLLFHGPPGCGKSATAKAIGLQLALPTFLVRFDGVIGAYLGQTAIHLRELFRFAESTPCVLIFDEVDALGKQRGSPLDVGELDRIVIAFMQELEHTTPAGLIVATSNLPKQLDPALWRRFDFEVEFPAPTRAELRSFAVTRVAKFAVRNAQKVMQRATSMRSYSDAERTIEAAVRERILANAKHQNGTRSTAR